MEKKINIEKKFLKFTDQWAPKIIAQLNDYQFKLVKIKGSFVWHRHDETDEVFFVIDGKMKIEFRNSVIELEKGEMYVVRKGVDHKPYAKEECKVMLIEPKGIINTGKTLSPFTIENETWI